MPANAELSVNGHPSMASSALALARVLVDDRTGLMGNRQTLSMELLERARRDDYDRWLNTPSLIQIRPWLHR